MGGHERRAPAPVGSTPETGAPANGAPGDAAPVSRSEQKNREAREALRPLGAGERPRVVTIGAAISALIAISIVVAYALGAEVDEERPTLVQVLVPTLLLAVMAWGMWRARYWAVLGFQALLLILIIAACLGLVQAGSLTQAVGNVVLVAVAGTLFYFMVKALARIQMPSRGEPS